MKDSNSFKIQNWSRGHAVEILINKVFEELLIWNNAEYVDGQYDSVKSSVADFKIKDSDVYLECQNDKPDWNQIYVYKRKLYKYTVKDDKIVYGELKENLDKIIMVQGNGVSIFYVAPMIKFKDAVFTEYFDGSRFNGEQVARVDKTEFIRMNAYEFKQFILTKKN
jgi:hypothetical protein